MKWSEVNYLLHDQVATVLFDTPKIPGFVMKHTGFISCPTIGAVPYLVSKQSNSKVMLPPDYAAVILHTPANPNWYW